MFSDHGGRKEPDASSVALNTKSLRFFASRSHGGVQDIYDVLSVDVAGGEDASAAEAALAVSAGEDGTVDPPSGAVGLFLIAALQGRHGAEAKRLSRCAQVLADAIPAATARSATDHLVAMGLRNPLVSMDMEAPRPPTPHKTTSATPNRTDAPGPDIDEFMASDSDTGSDGPETRPSGVVPGTVDPIDALPISQTVDAVGALADVRDYLAVLLRGGERYSDLLERVRVLSDTCEDWSRYASGLQVQNDALAAKVDALNNRHASMRALLESAV